MGLKITQNTPVILGESLGSHPAMLREPHGTQGSNQVGWSGEIVVGVTYLLCMDLLPVQS